MKYWKAPFMWLLINVYYKNYKKNNYIIVEPEEVTAATSKYRHDSDKYQEFLSEYIKETKIISDYISFVDFYKQFREWHSEAGYGRKIPTRNQFKDYLKISKQYEFDEGNIIGILYKIDYDNRVKKEKDKQKKEKEIEESETSTISDSEVSKKTKPKDKDIYISDTKSKNKDIYISDTKSKVKEKTTSTSKTDKSKSTKSDDDTDYDISDSSSNKKNKYMKKTKASKKKKKDESDGDISTDIDDISSYKSD
jgi:hypothetical protein